MGKHRKVINNDPILKKDYKYEKRKKQRAQQKEAQRQQLQKEEKMKQQIAQIEREVQQQLQQQLLNKISYHKHKKIDKIPKQLLCKKNVQKIGANAIVKRVCDQLVVKKCSEQQMPDFYQIHFGELPTRIRYVREHRQTKKQLIDRTVKDEVKGMFSMLPNQQDKHKMEDEKQKQIQNKLMHASQQNQTNPYMLQKQQIKQKQVIYSGPNIAPQSFLLTPEATHSTLHQIPLQTTKKQKQIESTIIESYHDMVFIQNKQEETIQQFRSTVIKHMVAHQDRCRRQQNNSKGFTNAKSVVLCPFFGDARAIMQIFEGCYSGYEIVDKQKFQDIEDQNDFFRVGVSINDKKKAIKYFSHFNVSNFIIGSPVGIKAIVGTQGQSERDFSFLSSVQILYIDRASVIYMQNWDHLIQVIKSMNLMPSPQSLCNDINKLRPSVPELMSRLYRQSIVFSQYNFPQLNALKHIHFNNWQGCYTSKVLYQALQYKKKTDFDVQFYKMEIKEPRNDLQMRFEFFKRKFWEDLCNNETMKKVVIFTRSYFEFIKLKQFLIRVKASADFISQHTKKPKVQSKIAHFNSGEFRILLTTQRAYYYNICQIKKFQHLYLYSTPRNAYIYSELLGQIYKQNSYVKNKVVAIYTKYDIMFLERIVGTRKAMEMVKEYCNNVSFIV